jgi:hypothetical protein
MYAAHFLEIDVDDLDQIASKYKVAIMPTFCIVTPVAVGATNADAAAGAEMRVDTLTGSNEERLRHFMETSLTKRSNNN